MILQLTSCQVGAVGGGLANTVGSVTEGLGNTVKSGGNIAREGLSSEEGEGEGSTTPARAPDTADEVTSKFQGIDEAPNKNPEATNGVMQRFKDATVDEVTRDAGNTSIKAAAEVPGKGTYATNISETKKYSIRHKHSE